jgi:hypothetical protein
MKIEFDLELLEVERLRAFLTSSRIAAQQFKEDDLIKLIYKMDKQLHDQT